MITTTYMRHDKSWKAVARFPHAVNPYKYHEYNYRGYGKTPEEATNELMAQLAANEYVYDFIYFIPERLTRYRPTIRYNHWDNAFFCEMEFEHQNGETSSVLGEGETPQDAFSAALLAISLQGVYLPPNQLRKASDLFTV